MAGRSHPGVPRDGDELRQAIEDAGETLTVPDPPLQVRAAYRRAMHDLMNDNPPLSDRRLRYRGRDRGDLVMSIVAIEELPAQKPPTEAIAVPETLRGCHPIIRTTQNGAKSSKGWIDTYRVEGMAHLRIHRASLRRCLLVLQALISEGERRGYPAVLLEKGCRGLGLEVSGFIYELAVKEETTRIVGAENAIQGPHAASSYSWIRPPSLSVLRSRARSGSPIDAGLVHTVSGACCSRARCGRWSL